MALAALEMEWQRHRHETTHKDYSQRSSPIKTCLRHRPLCSARLVSELVLRNWKPPLPSRDATSCLADEISGTTSSSISQTMRAASRSLKCCQHRIRCGPVAASAAETNMQAWTRAKSSYSSAQGWPLWTLGAVGAAVAATAGVSICVQSAGSGWLHWVLSSASADQVPHALAVHNEASLQRLREWLMQQGADISLTEVKHSPASHKHAGYGMFLAPNAKTQYGSRHHRRWWWPFSTYQEIAPPVAQFPLKSAITAANILNDPELRSGCQWLLKQGHVDERVLIMAYLVIERLKGQASHLAPWLNLLPKSFDTPMWYSPSEMEELRGTTLYNAVGAIKGRLDDLWDKLEPSLNAIAHSAGIAGHATYADLLWAYSVFWSRGHGIPIPQQEGAASSLVAKRSSKAVPLEIQEGIIPGLDFCNHSNQPNVWWEVLRTPHRQPPPSPQAPSPPHQQQQQQQDIVPSSASTSTATTDAGDVMIQLQVHSGRRVQPGEELCISYGDKSNEELLMLYGFAIPDNPHDYLMLHCPIPPQTQWDDVMYARMELLQAMHLKPQFFLKLSGLPASSLDSPATASSSSSSSKGAACSSQAGSGSILPAEVLDALEVFVLDTKELALRIDSLREASTGQRLHGSQGAVQLPPPAPPTRTASQLDLAALNNKKASLNRHELEDVTYRLGLRMAALSTFVRLVESKVVGLEDSQEGTRPLEQDEQLLRSPPDSSSHAYRKWCCVVYRHEQKRIAREYVKAGRKELQDVMHLLQELEQLKLTVK